MQASLLNLESSVSKLDIVNEHLEVLESNPSQSQGTFLNIIPETESSDGDQRLLLATMPQHSSPAISENPQVTRP